MTRSSAREIAVHIIFALGFDTRNAQEILDAELTRERFQELAEELPLYAQFPNEKQEQYIRQLVQGYLPTVRSWTTLSAAIRWAGPSPVFPVWRRR